MYFTKTRELNKYENMMKRTPDIGSKRSEEDMPTCNKCLNMYSQCKETHRHFLVRFFIDPSGLTRTYGILLN